VDEFQSSFDVATSHHHVWSYCAADFALDPKVDWKKSQLGAPPAKFCPETMTNEQLYQLTWFGHHVAQGHESPQRFVPPFLDCIHLPPAGYVWPKKHPELPSPGDAVHWPNLRASQRTDLVEFNRGTPKNLYHFEAGVYDKDGLDELSIAAKYIPLQKKVRNMLDIGAGGGSLGVLLKAKYNIQTIASAFADWPYCEYMTERGELCLMLDVMEAMPFAKFSFDMIHISWVYHGQRPEELWEFLHEVDRIIRPGGYLYMRGGWSNSQIVAQRSMLSWLGYTLLHEVVSNKPAAVTAKVSFGEGLPYHADWTAIYVKPIRASPADPAFCEGKAKQERNGKVVEPLPVRTPPTNMGNVYEQ
jgi:SAM-dependent methyltransferase